MTRASDSTRRNRSRTYDRYDQDHDWNRDRHGSREHDARSRGDAVEEFFENALQGHPLLLGAGAALVGAIAGALIPNSEQENEMLGEHRERAVHEGARRGREVAEQAIAGAERAIDAAFEEFTDEFSASGEEEPAEEDEGEAGAGEDSERESERETGEGGEEGGEDEEEEDETRSGG